MAKKKKMVPAIDPLDTGAFELAKLSIALVDSSIRSGELHEAVEFLYVAKKIYGKHDPVSLMRCLELLSYINNHIGQLKRALHFARGCYQLAASNTSDREIPAVKHRLGLSCSNLGSLYLKLMKYRKARPFLENAIRLLVDLIIAFPENKIYLKDLGIAYAYLGNYYDEFGPVDKAAKYYWHTHDIGLELTGREPGNVVFKELLAHAYHHQSKFFFKKENWYEAGMSNVESIFIMEELCKSFPTDMVYKKFMSQLLTHSIALQKNNKGYKNAFESAYRAISINEEMLELSKDDLDVARNQAYCYLELGQLYELIEEPDYALSCFHEFNNRAEQLYLQHAQHIEIKQIMGQSNKYMGIRYLNRGYRDLALEHFARSWWMYRDLHNQYAKDLNFMREFASANEWVGKIFWYNKAWDRTLEYLLKATDIYKRVHEANPGGEEDKQTWKNAALLTSIVFFDLEDHRGYIPAPVKKWWRSVKDWFVGSIRIFRKNKPTDNAFLDFFNS